MKQPEGYEGKGREQFVYKLRKNTYDLKQAAQVWNNKLHEVLIKNRLKRAEDDHRF